MVERQEPADGRHGRTIGVFDSGVGGLSVVRAMLAQPRPDWSNLIYLADLEHFPYGPRPAAEVRRLAASGVETLAELGAELVLIACNTASAAGMRTGAPNLPVPILDIIGPGARRAVEVARRAAGPAVGQAGASSPAVRVIVLGTEGTIRSGTWNQALADAGYDGPVVGWPCPFLATIIEDGASEERLRQGIADATRGLRGLEAGGIQDVVVLGCTHFPLATPIFAEVLAGEVLGRPVAVVDPAEALVSELSRRLAAGFAITTAETGARTVGVRFLTTARTGHFRERAAALLAAEIGAGHHRLLLDRVGEVYRPELSAGGR